MSIMEKTVAELTTEEIIALVGTVALTYEQASGPDFLDLHETYARRVIDAVATEENFVLVLGKPYLRADFVRSLVEQRQAVSAQREQERAQRIQRAEQTRAELEARKEARKAAPAMVAEGEEAASTTAVTKRVRTKVASPGQRLAQRSKVTLRPGGKKQATEEVPAVEVPADPEF